MCRHCLLKSLPRSDVGVTWPEVTEQMRVSARLVDEFVHAPGLELGGPLHCEIGDSNLDDEIFERFARDDTLLLAEFRDYFLTTTCYASAFDGGKRSYRPTEVESLSELALRLVRSLESLSEAERQVVVEIGQGYLSDYGASYFEPLDKNELAHLQL